MFVRGEGIGTKGNLPRICEMVNRPDGMGTTTTTPKLMNRGSPPRETDWIENRRRHLLTSRVSVQISSPESAKNKGEADSAGGGAVQFGAARNKFPASPIAIALPSSLARPPARSLADRKRPIALTRRRVRWSHSFALMWLPEVPACCASFAKLRRSAATGVGGRASERARRESGEVVAMINPPR